VAGLNADLCLPFGMVLNKKINEAMQIIGYIVCTIGIAINKDANS
jgi:hypothetical protein